jgi:hypothetical protein
MIAVVETEEFLADVKSVLSEDEREALIWYVAQYPEAGDLITGNRWVAKVTMDSEGEGQARRIASDLLLSQPRCSTLSDGDICEKRPDRFVGATTGGSGPAASRAQ